MIEAVCLLTAELEALCIVRRANSLESEVDEHGEELPVVAAGDLAVYLREPTVEVRLLFVGERIPHLLGRENERKTERRHLNYLLVAGYSGDVTPVFLALGIGTACDTLGVYLVKIAR